MFFISAYYFNEYMFIYYGCMNNKPEALVILSLNLLQIKYVSRGSTSMFCRNYPVTTKAEEENIRLKDMKSCMHGSILYSSFLTTTMDRCHVVKGTENLAYLAAIYMYTSRENSFCFFLFRAYLYKQCLNNIFYRKIHFSSYMTNGLGGALLQF